MPAPFEIAYDGEALRDGTMDVRDIAPALLSVGRLVENANRVLNGDRATVSVRVVAGTEPGSFPSELLLTLSMPEQLVSFAGRSDVVLAGALLQHLGFSAAYDATKGAVFSLLDFMRQKKGKEIVHQEVLQDGGTNVFLEGENNSIYAPTVIVNLAQDPGVQNELRRILEPLKKEGIDEFQIREPRSGRVIKKVTKDEVQFFEPSEGVTELEEHERIQWAYIKKAVFFDESRKWQFWDGNQDFSAFMRDKDFWRQIHEGLPLGEGYMLQMTLRVRQAKKPDGRLQTEIEVVRVHDYKPAAKQYDWVDEVED